MHVLMELSVIIALVAMCAQGGTIPAMFSGLISFTNQSVVAPFACGWLAFALRRESARMDPSLRTRASPGIAIRL